MSDGAKAFAQLWDLAASRSQPPTPTPIGASSDGRDLPVAPAGSWPTDPAAFTSSTGPIATEGSASQSYGAPNWDQMQRARGVTVQTYGDAGPDDEFQKILDERARLQEEHEAWMQGMSSWTSSRLTPGTEAPQEPADLGWGWPNEQPPAFAAPRPAPVQASDEGWGSTLALAAAIALALYLSSR